jgi:hypothetical protein
VARGVNEVRVTSQASRPTRIPAARIPRRAPPAVTWRLAASQRNVFFLILQFLCPDQMALARDVCPRQSR